MISIVIVSHSARLAAGVKELAEQMAQGRVKIFAVGGLDFGTLGTNVEAILLALTEADNSHGTLVLMDLGSAVLGAEVALELLPAEMRARVRLCAAPLVEGAVAAGVQASLGNDLETVCREAMRALDLKATLDPKAGHLGEPLSSTALGSTPLPPGHSHRERVILTLLNAYGLHARPAARVVQTVSIYEADVTVEDLTNGKGPVSARSLNRLATLGAVQGHQICVEAAGPQAAAVLAAVRALVADNFGEGAVSEAQPAVPLVGQQGQARGEPVPAGTIQAVPVAEGFVVAPSARLRPPQPIVPSHITEDPEGDWAALEKALEAARQRIGARRLRLAAKVGEVEARIFDAHLLILGDPELLENARTRIFDQKMNAALAWDQSIKEVIEAYENLADAYLRRRAQDVFDAGNQVLQALTGQAEWEITFEQPVILVARELAPSEIARLDIKKVVGLATVQGGPTSHSAILARAAGIPALTGIPAAVLDLEDGASLALDGFTGRLWILPGEEVRSEITAKREAWLAQKERRLEAGHRPAVTLDGEVIQVAANVGGLAEAEAAVQSGADGIGLLRTEFLFLKRSTPPGEEAQVQSLASIFTTLRGRPVIVRTLDVGGDKPLPYIDLPSGANPYLGVRAIRLSQRRPDLLLAQLRAVLHCGPPGITKIMFPLITNLDEVQFGKAVLEKAHQELKNEGIEHAWPVETGIMVETPAAALLAPVLAPHVDFFSIGTNDLTQYTLAAERGNPELAGYSDALHPAVLQLIRQVVLAAQLHGKWVGVCGELAGDPVAVPVLVGLGVRELSMSPGSIPKIKAIIGQIRVDAAVSLAAQVLQSASAAAARALAQAFLDQVESRKINNSGKSDEFLE